VRTVRWRRSKSLPKTHLVSRVEKDSLTDFLSECGLYTQIEMRAFSIRLGYVLCRLSPLTSKTSALMLSARAMTLFTVAVAISLSFLSCGQDEMKRIAEKPIEARSAEEIKRFLVGRWKLGENRLDGVYISRDSVRMINEKGSVVRGHPWGGKVGFMNQSKIRVKMNTGRDTVGLEIAYKWDTLVSKSDESEAPYAKEVGDEYVRVIKVISRDSIKWWISEKSLNWGDVDGEPILIRAEGSSVPSQ